MLDSKKIYSARSKLSSLFLILKLFITINYLKFNQTSHHLFKEFEPTTTRTNHLLVHNWLKQMCYQMAPVEGLELDSC